MAFDEKDHPRGQPENKGQFVKKGEKSEYSNLPSAKKLADSVPKNAWEQNGVTKMTSTEKIVKVDLDTDIQKQFDNATPKERSKIAYRYIMDNLCGKYATEDGRVVTISGIGADKMSHTTNETKIRVLPQLANLIKAGELQGVKQVTHKKFAQFAYYKVRFQIGDDQYTALLNVGIRPNGDSTLYDINPFNKQ